MSARNQETPTFPDGTSGPRAAVRGAQQALTSSASVEIRSRWVEVAGRSKVHYLESGSGEPLVLLHGSGNSSADWVPLIEQPIDRRALAVDRPGFGLSDVVEFDPSRVREVSVSFIDSLLDALALEAVDIVGSSGGSVIALWMAIDRPHRVKSLALMGATPLLPGTRAPLPLRLMTSLVAPLLSRFMPDPSPRSVIKMMGTMGEGESMIRYPRLLDVYVAAASDRMAGEASSRELGALIRGLRGFRPELVFGDEDLRKVSQPTIMVWGDRDPVGGLDSARHAARLLPDSELHVLSAGHVPWWAEPAEVARLLGAFYGKR